MTAHHQLTSKPKNAPAHTTAAAGINRQSRNRVGSSKRTVMTITSSSS
jgi:hypothetical protein